MNDITLSIITKLLAGLISLLIVVRLLGKKTLSEMTPYDFIYTLVLGGILEESIYDDNVAVWQVVMGIALWAALIYVLEIIAAKNDSANTVFKGEPSVLIYEGKIVHPELKRNKVEFEQLRGLMRVQSCFSLKNCQHMILETGGQISLTLYDSKDTKVSLFVVDEGEIQKEVLDNHQLDVSWLLEELADLGHSNINDIVYAEWFKKEGFHVVTRDQLIKERVLLDG